MAKPELGTKRLCPSCGAKYYDLNRDPITCPKCGTIFEIVMISRSARASKAAAVVDDEDEEDEEAPEIVTLEEADAEAEGSVDDVPDLDDDEEVDLGEDDAADDEIFIDDEDEEEDSVPGIRVEREDDREV